MSRPEGPPNVQNTNICRGLFQNGFPSSHRTKYLKSLFRDVAVTPITSQSRGHISTVAESTDRSPTLLTDPQDGFGSLVVSILEPEFAGSKLAEAVGLLYLFFYFLQE
jgi:hypothetical protein